MYEGVKKMMYSINPKDQGWTYDDINCQFVIWLINSAKKGSSQNISACPMCSSKNISVCSILIHDNDIFDDNE